MRTTDQLGMRDNTITVFFSDNGGVHWMGNRAEGNKEDCPISSNLPLRGGKATIYEGGTRVPLIAVWPGLVEPGSRRDELVSSIDFYPTLLEMARIEPKAGHRFDGITIVPAFKGKPLRKDSAFCHFPHYVRATGNLPSTYVRKDDEKLIRLYADNSDQMDRFELYNLKNDVGETFDFADRMPKKVKELNISIECFLQETNAVVPKANPNYKGTQPGP